ATSLRVCIACASRRGASVGGDCLFTPVILLTRRHIAVSTSHGKHRFEWHATSLRCPDTSRRCDGARPQAQFGYESRARAPAYRRRWHTADHARADLTNVMSSRVLPPPAAGQRAKRGGKRLVCHEAAIELVAKEADQIDIRHFGGAADIVGLAETPLMIVNAIAGEADYKCFSNAC